MITPVILAGGNGSRLWPLSRKSYPKQFLPLTGQGSMLQMTLQRLEALQPDAPYVICNEDHRFLVAEQLRQQGVNDACIMLEPEGRNTAPAIALAALQATRNGDDPLLFVLPADHQIRDAEAMHRCVREAMALADEGRIVTFGITPTQPETGYGYIRRDEPIGEHGFGIRQFVEKPDTDTAQAYLDSGDYYWNSGMFLLRAKCYLQELERYQPEMLSVCRASLDGTLNDTLGFVRVDAAAFASCPANSIDYAVMEKTERSAMVPLDAGWSDIGSWSSLWDVSDKDDCDNLLQGDVLARDSRGLTVRADSRLVATLGVEDLVVIETTDAVLVADKSRVQDVGKLVDELKDQQRSECENHREVYRPWGSYDSIDRGDRYQVKRITVNPGAKLSVQMHHHRAEHWVVVSGTAKVTNGEDTYLVTENESTYIPIGQVHALENPGTIPLELIEIQSGSYLGEDDIVRFEDKYGRA